MRFNSSVYLALFLFVLPLQTWAQTPSPTVVPNDNDVVKINTNLVQLDAVVTDKNGDAVTTLSKGDFEIFQDGKRREITNFSFVNTSVIDDRSERFQKVAKNAPIPPTRRRANSTGRVITFVVDDGNCTASTTGMDLARKGLRDFISKQMFPTDLVAIYRTRSGSGSLQQYTSDRAQLLKVVKKIRWFPTLGCSGSGDFFSAARQNESLQDDEPNPDDLNDDGLTDYERERQQTQGAEDVNRDDQIVGTLGVIRYIVKGLDRVRGRKIVFLMSDGLPTLDEKGNSRQAREVLGKLTEEANRSSVVLNTIDVRGVLTPGMITASDDIKVQKRGWDIQKSRTEQISQSRRSQYRSSQDSLAFIADETGGKFYRGSNNLANHLRRAMNIEKGYYLLGYEPDEETFKGRNFHKIEVKLNRPELKVFSRAGFVGREDRKSKTNRTEKGELYDAIIAPLPEAGLDLRLTAFYGNSATKGNFVRSLVHVAGKDIEFVDDKDGNKKAVFDVVAVTLDKKNRVVDEFTRAHTIKVKSGAIPFIRQNGLTYTTDVGVKKPGVYNFRMAIRDVNSKQIGSATQVVEIPKFRKGRIYISGLSIGEVNQNGRFEAPAAKTPERAISLVGSQGVAEIRTFSAGTRLGYSYTIYNAKLDSATGEPIVGVSLNLYKNGRLLSKGISKTAQLGLQSDWSRVKVKGYLQLDRDFDQADYALQVVVRDLVGKRVSSQWVDFEVN